MAHGDPLKTRFAFRILPGNIQHVRIGCAGDDLESLHLIPRVVDRLSIYPGSMGQDGAVLGMNGLYGVEFYVGLRRATIRGFLIFQKDGQDFDRPVGFVSCVLQLQEDTWFCVNESKSKRLLVVVICAHKFSLRGLVNVSVLSGDWDLNQQTCDKSSQLIEIIWSR